MMNEAETMQAATLGPAGALTGGTIGNVEDYAKQREAQMAMMARHRKAEARSSAMQMALSLPTGGMTRTATELIADAEAIYGWLTKDD